MVFDFKQVHLKPLVCRIPQNKLSQHANMLTFFSSCFTHLEEPILKLTPLNALLDFFLPSIDSRLILFKSSMVTLFADSQSVLSCSNAAFFTSSSFFRCCSLVVLSFCLLSRSRSLSDSFCFFSRTFRSKTSSISLSILFSLATCSFCSSSIMNKGFLLGTLSVPATPASFLHLKFS